MADELPVEANYANYLHLVSARVEEMHHLDKTFAARDNSDGGRAYQRLPRHLRRRALSSNPKRVPRNMRARHIAECGAPPKKKKRPSSKYRKRPRDRAAAYTKRQTRPGNTWLETHLWHAKRFHMTRAWGYALPAAPTQKMYRPILRALEQRCVMQDRSYLCCLELRGPVNALQTGLTRLLSHDGFTRVFSEPTLSGTRWTSATLYQMDCCPCGALGDADLHWLPGSDAERLTLWMWIHPSAYHSVLQALISVFGLLETKNEKDTCVDMPVADQAEAQGESHTFSYNEKNDNTRTHTFPLKPDAEMIDAENSAKSKIKRRYLYLAAKLSRSNEEDFLNEETRVSVKSLRDTLNRFTFRGPETCRVLSHVLVPTELSSMVSENEWWKTYYSSNAARDALALNLQTWRSIIDSCSTADGCYRTLSDWIVLPILVRDPRMILPRKREKIPVLSVSEAQVQRLPCPASAPDSPLFSSTVRHSLLFTRLTDAQINKRRHECVIPGSAMPLNDDEARLPALLLVKPPLNEHDKLNHIWSSVWELILPGGWGSNAWTALVYAGAVPAGLDHQTHLVCEEFDHPPAYLLPDTPAGHQYAQQQAAARRLQYFSKPPDKRPNYIKLAVHHPFGAPWPKLLKSAATLHEFLKSGYTPQVLSDLGFSEECKERIDSSTNDSAPFCVLRDNKLLKILDFLTCSTGNRRRIFKSFENEENSINGFRCESIKSEFPICAASMSDALTLLSGTQQLVRVMLTPIGNGSIEPCAMICRPSPHDLRRLTEFISGKMRPGENLIQDITEPRVIDEKDNLRRSVKLQHTADLTRLRRLRKKARREVRENFVYQQGIDLATALTAAVHKVHEQHKELTDRTAAYQPAMEELWLPPVEKHLLLLSRTIIGYVTEAAFSRARGCGAGHGFVVSSALLPVWRRRLELFSGGLSREQEDGGLDVAIVADRGIPVLYRNTSTLQYGFAMLTISLCQPPS